MVTPPISRTDFAFHLGSIGRDALEQEAWDFGVVFSKNVPDDILQQNILEAWDTLYSE